MRQFILLFSFVFLATASTSSFSQDEITGDPASTRVEADPENSEIRFFIDGTVAAVLRADGLHVRNSIFYGGRLTDVGAEGFTALSKQDVKEADNYKE